MAIAAIFRALRGADLARKESCRKEQKQPREKCAHEPSGAGLLEDVEGANRAGHPKYL